MKYYGDTTVQHLLITVGDTEPILRYIAGYRNDFAQIIWAIFPDGVEQLSFRKCVHNQQRLVSWSQWNRSTGLACAMNGIDLPVNLEDH